MLGELDFPNAAVVNAISKEIADLNRSEIFLYELFITVIFKKCQVFEDHLLPIYGMWKL